MSVLSPPPTQPTSRRELSVAANKKSTHLEGWCRARVLAHLGQVRGGVINYADDLLNRRVGAAVEADPLEADLTVRSPRFFRRVAFGGALGAAESYMAGEWTSDDLPQLLQIFARNYALTVDMNGWATRWRLPMLRLRNWLRRNSVSGSRKNIAAHYDLSNAFYQLWLDRSMTYSSGVFPDERASLEEAMLHKNELLCEQLRLQPSDHLLEIGTGWGGFAIHVAKNYGCRVTTTTISRQQFDYARQQIEQQGLQDRIELLDQDYRNLGGRYDKVVSVEMIEAVGHEFLPTYFAKCDELLQPGGRFVMQAITIPDQRYDVYRRSTDFIQQYIFPGGALPSIGAIVRATSAQTSLLLTHCKDYATDYARTLASWRERFFQRVDQVAELGFDERFIRMWDYYLSYCEAGFREQQIGLAQIAFDKPR